MQVQWPNNDSVLDWMSAMVNFSERVDMLTRVEYVSHAAHCLHSNGHTDLGMEYLFGLMEKLGQEPAELRFQLLEEVAWTFIYGGRKEHVGKVFDKMASVADSDPELAERLAALRDAVAESGSETTDEDDFTSPVDELESMTADELHGAILHELQELLAAKDDPYSNVHHWPILFGAYL